MRVDILLVALIAVDALAAVLCLRARAYTIGIALCAVTVPISLLISTLMFGAVERQRAAGVTPADEFILLGAACLLTAAVAAVWALIVGARRLRRRVHVRSATERHPPVRSLY